MQRKLSMEWILWKILIHNHQNQFWNHLELKKDNRLPQRHLIKDIKPTLMVSTSRPRWISYYQIEIMQSKIKVWFKINITKEDILPMIPMLIGLLKLPKCLRNSFLNKSCILINSKWGRNQPISHPCNFNKCQRMNSCKGSSMLIQLCSNSKENLIHLLNLILANKLKRC